MTASPSSADKGELEFRYRTLFESAPIGISINTSDGTFVKVNRTFQLMMGYTEEELTQRTFKDITLPEDLEESKRLFGELCRGERDGFRIEKRYIRKDGQILWANTACAAVRNTDGSFAYTFAMVEDITERKKGQLELLSSENRYHSLYENSIDAIILATVDGTIESANPEACRVFGMSEQEICAAGRSGLVDPSDPRLTLLLEDRRRTGKFRGELRFRRKDGTTFEGDVSSAFYKDKHGSPRALIMIRDITERKQNEKALHNLVAGTATVTGTEFFSVLVRHLAEALNVKYALVAECIGEEGLRVRSLACWSGSMKENYEYALAGTPCDVVLREGKMCFYPDHIRELFPTDYGLRPLGAVCYLGTPLFDNSGKAIGHIFVIDDKPLSDPERAKSIVGIFAARAAMELQRKRAEERIRDQAALLDNAHDAIAARSLEGRILYWNQSCQVLYGWKPQEALGAKYQDLLHRSPSPEFDTASESLLKLGKWTGELTHVTKDGKEVTVQSSWTLVRDEEGMPGTVLVISTDITEKKKLEAHFLRAQRMESIGTLAGGVAHDLNNVLTPIILAVETLLQGKTDERSQKLLAMIESNAKRGADMAHQVLAFARGMEGVKVTIEPKHLIKEVEKIARETFPKSIRVEARTARDLTAVSGNATQLHQVLLNLCLNARDAMPNGGVLRITADNALIDEGYARMNPEAKPGKYVVLTVSDTGVGIAPENLPRVFEPFFTTKGIGMGTGLGLSTAAGIVKSHNGFVHAYSELGKGSEFRVYIPAIEVGTEARKERKKELPVGNGETILIVDDESSVLEVTRSTLEAHGYKVLIAADGTEALAQYAKHSGEIQVVLTDMMMPYMDGAATIRALERMDPHVKIIASSGMIRTTGAPELGSSQVKAFIPKPYTAEKLLTTLREVLQRK